MGKARELPVCPPAPAPSGSAESLQRDVRDSCSVLHQGKARSLRPPGPCQRGSRGWVSPWFALGYFGGNNWVSLFRFSRGRVGVRGPSAGAPRAAPAAVPRAVSALRCPGGDTAAGPARPAWLSTARSFSGAPEPGPASRGAGCPPSPPATS